MKDILITVGSIIGTLGGWEAVKYMINRKTNARKAEAEADSSEFSVLRDTVIFLEKQLQQKEERFAEQTNLVRQLTNENLELSREIAILKTERGLKLCEKRNCKKREPQSGY